jgi:hypothetical protein
VYVKGAPHHSGVDEVLEQEVGRQDDDEHDGRRRASSLAKSHDDGEPAPEECTDVWDVAPMKFATMIVKTSGRPSSMLARPMTMDTTADMTVRPRP